MKSDIKLLVKRSLRPLSTLGCALMLGALGSCSSDDNSGGNTSITVKPDFNVEFTYEDMLECKGLENFSYNFMSDAVANDNLMDLSGENFAISPLSCAIDMAMLAQSTDSLSARKLCNLLGVSNTESLGIACNKLMTYLPAPENGVEFDVVNSVWYATRNASYIPTEYIKKMNSTYFADVNSADLATDEGMRVINSWVNAKTKGLISDLNGLFVPSSSVDALLLNALHFKGEWESKFDAKLTTDEVFHPSDGDKQVKMMHHNLRITCYCEDDEKVVFQLDFKGERMQMTFVLPKEGVKLADACLEAEEWRALMKNSLNYQYDLTLSMPRFSINSIVRMRELPILSSLANISLDGMGLPNGSISSIGQKIYINIDEEGAKLAAVTGTGWETAPEEPEIKKVSAILDRPFLFYVNNFKTGAVIMAGRVLDPTKN